VDFNLFQPNANICRAFRRKFSMKGEEVITAMLSPVM